MYLDALVVIPDISKIQGYEPPVGQVLSSHVDDAACGNRCLRNVFQNMFSR